MICYETIQKARWWLSWEVGVGGGSLQAGLGGMAPGFREKSCLFLLPPEILDSEGLSVILWTSWPHPSTCYTRLLSFPLNFHLVPTIGDYRAAEQWSD